VLGDHHQSVVCKQPVVDDYLRQWFRREVRQRNGNDEFPYGLSIQRKKDKYTSPEIQNEILSIISDQIIRSLAAEIRHSHLRNYLFSNHIYLCFVDILLSFI
jgi:hypothetical protein